MMNKITCPHAPCIPCYKSETQHCELNTPTHPFIVLILAMSSSFAIHFFLISIPLFSVCCLSASHAPSTKPHPFILPIKKDPATNLFYTSVGVGTPRHNFDLTIDLAGENLWYDCNTHYNSSSYRPIACGSKQCPDVGCVGCNGPFKPGCTNNTCPANTINPLAKFIFGGGLAEDFIFIVQQKVSGLLSSCIDTDGFTSFTNDESPLNGLPKNSRGIIGLSESQFVFPMHLLLAGKQLRLMGRLGTKNLPFFILTSREKGAWRLAPSGPSLNSQPLFANLFFDVFTRNPSVEGFPTKEHFTPLGAVQIDGKVVNLKPSLLAIDNKGNGGTNLSTMSPFTELQTTGYKTFIRVFIKKASDRRLKGMVTVAPWEACYGSTSGVWGGLLWIKVQVFAFDPQSPGFSLLKGMGFWRVEISPVEENVGGFFFKFFGGNRRKKFFFFVKGNPPQGFPVGPFEGEAIFWNLKKNFLNWGPPLLQFPKRENFLLK
uniref:Basic 7S globulin n=1 Tax=Phaseolus vulgaris TaxID=3885 RepID=T2DP23_PHAVU|nr:basic 7S globulin [Phaseolus vulgaris]